MPQQSGLRLDNRSTGLLAGLIVLVAIGILVAIWLDGGGDDSVETTSEAPLGSVADADADPEPVVLPTVAVIPTAVAPEPTSVFVASGSSAGSSETASSGSTTSDSGTDAAAAADDESETGLASGFEDESEDGTFGFEDESAESFPTPTPAEESAEATPRPNDPFAFAGDSSWWVQGIEDDGATVSTNELDFIINQDGTGSMRGTLDVEWTDGRAWMISLDQDFTWDTTSANVRSTITGGDITMDGEPQSAATMAIRSPDDGFGSLCFAAACVSFQYEPPFWSLSPDA